MPLKSHVPEPCTGEGQEGPASLAQSAQVVLGGKQRTC